VARITVIPLFKSQSLSAGDSGTSDVIDLRYNSNRGVFSLAHSIAAGTSTTCGTTVFSYVGCSTIDGTYVSPNPAAGTSGTIGTSGPTIVGKITLFAPTLVPFMKVIATQTGAGTAGANSKITAELIVQ
jgi:hypothetical protein